MAVSHKVTGTCPMGCGETLFLGDGGEITCSFERCPNPSAVSELLSPAASAQRQDEETEVMRLLETTEKRRQALEDEARTLVRSLEGAWWLAAAGAYHRLAELTGGST